MFLKYNVSVNTYIFTSKILPSEKAIPSITPKPVIARTSSMLAAAITRVGIPLLIP